MGVEEAGVVVEVHEGTTGVTLPTLSERLRFTPLERRRVGK